MMTGISLGGVNIEILALVTALVVVVTSWSIQIHHYSQTSKTVMDSALVMIGKGEGQIDRLTLRTEKLEMELIEVRTRGLYLEEGIRVLTHQLIVLGIQPDWNLPKRLDGES